MFVLPGHIGGPEVTRVLTMSVSVLCGKWVWFPGRNSLVCLILLVSLLLIIEHKNLHTSFKWRPEESIRFPLSGVTVQVLVSHPTCMFGTEFQS